MYPVAWISSGGIFHSVLSISFNMGDSKSQSNGDKSRGCRDCSWGVPQYLCLSFSLVCSSPSTRPTEVFLSKATPVFHPLSWHHLYNLRISLYPTPLALEVQYCVDISMILFTKYLCAALSLELLVTCISAEYDTKEVEFSGNGGRADETNGLCSGSSCTKRAINGVSGAMWFGPRLGRRRRSDEKSETDVDEIGAIADVLNAAPWALVSIPEGKRHVFTPRLGRELAEEYLLYNSLNGAAQGGNQDDVEQRSPPFAPRLGRRLPFVPSPRLGRQLRAFLRKV